MPETTHPPFRPFYVTGPTGSGKSALALRLAEAIGGEIVNADAFQLYRGIPIITAAPSAADRERAPHHLYEILSPAESCDAGRYLSLIEPVLQDLRQTERLPIVVGGSGLYIKAVTHGFQDAPPSSPTIRGQLEPLSLEALQERLRELDPESAASINLLNRRYVQRAVEICLTTGRPASEFRESWKSDPPGLRGILLTHPREDLYARINARAEEMLREGAQEEVAAVEAWSDTASKAIGVREIRQHLASEIDRDQCLHDIRQASRRYAKRQITWFKRERWLEALCPGEGPEAGDVVTGVVARFGLVSG